MPAIIDPRVPLGAYFETAGPSCTLYYKPKTAVETVGKNSITNFLQLQYIAYFIFIMLPLQIFGSDVGIFQWCDALFVFVSG